MIHILELLIFIACFAVVIHFYKKASIKPDNKSIAIFSTIIASISIITLFVGYLWLFYNHNIDWSFIRPDWQEVNSKGWNDINYIEDKIGAIIFLVSGIMNPLIAFLAVGYAMEVSMKDIIQPTNQIFILLLFIIPILLSVTINIGLSNIFAKIARKIYRKIKKPQIPQPPL